MFSVVILSRNLANLQPCVSAVLTHEPQSPPSRIVVVDDDESGQIKEYCAANGLTRAPGEKPFIFARNANIGIEKAFADGSKAVILLNDDALLRTRHGFSSLYMAAMFPEGNYGLVSASCDNVGNENQFHRGSKIVRRESRMLCFVSVLIPKATWEKVGKLDERYSGYGMDDDDYSLRVRHAGMRLGVWDSCYVDHGSLTSTFRGPAGTGGDFSGNLELFKQKWGFDNHGRPA